MQPVAGREADRPWPLSWINGDRKDTGTAAASLFCVGGTNVERYVMKRIRDIEQFLLNMNEFVYAVDIEMNEIVFMNNKILEVYGLKSLEDVKGKKCYEVLQRGRVPCGMCNNDRLREGYFEEWKYFNPLIDKYLLIKDTLMVDSDTGKKYRIEIAIDITEERQQDKALQKYRDMEPIVNDALKRGLAADTPDETIQIILEHLGKVLNAERTYIFEKNAQGCDDNTYEWTAEGISPEIDNLQNVPPSVCEYWYKIFESGGCVVIPDLDATKEIDPLQYENLKRQGIHSIVVIPLFEKESIIGFYGVDNPPLIDLSYISSLLQIMGSFLSSCIKRRNLMRKLEHQSKKDPLTGLGNRFALGQYAETINRENSLGVIYCDITGLKFVNDTAGHDAGDRLIQEASKHLGEVFGDHQIFRVGGDEFLVICSSVEENVLMERIKRLKGILKDSTVNIAVGAVWVPEQTEGLEALMSKAEKMMYKDKAEYYRKNGIERRRQSLY